DDAGNSGTATDDQAYTVDIVQPPSGGICASITLDPITGDDAIDATEACSTITLTGNVGGSVQPGDPVTLTVNGQDYLSQIKADGTFSFEIAGGEILCDEDRTIDVSVTTSDGNGNTATAVYSRSYVDVRTRASILAAEEENSDFFKSDSIELKEEEDLTPYDSHESQEINFFEWLVLKGDQESGESSRWESDLNEHGEEILYDTNSEVEEDDSPADCFDWMW
ncbi:Ig-like domain-containing protein, partial [Rhodobacterales bacterium HKCCSP123]|nr:Ig-like domain-containing protein [Rhodobacterales bacterium HKCCSP123]